MVGFAIAYLILNLLYQGLIIWVEPNADPFTKWVANLCTLFFASSEINHLADTPGYVFKINGGNLVNIKEGCNGIAVFITVLSYIIAFKGKLKDYFWFIPLAFLLIQIGNMLRLILLINIKISYPLKFDFYHTYAFPAIIYAFAFMLMIWWTKKLATHE